MRISKILISAEVQEKIFKKHGIKREEIEEGLLQGNSKCFKTRTNRYLAIAHKNGYLTIVFGCRNSVAEILTAYRSSDWQIRLYKRK